VPGAHPLVQSGFELSAPVYQPTAGSRALLTSHSPAFSAPTVYRLPGFQRIQLRTPLA
jgi:hypothetical protein